MQMTLRQKIFGQVAATLVGLLLVSAAALWGINALHQDYGVALDGYHRLRQAYVAGTHLQTAQKFLLFRHPASLSAARAEVNAAVTSFSADDSAATKPSPGAGTGDAAVDDIRRSLRTIAGNLELLEMSPVAAPPEAVGTQRDAIVAQLGKISQLSSDIRLATEQAQTAAANRRKTTFVLVGGLCGAVVLLSILLGVLHYRGVMNPIRRLTDGVRQLTRGHFKGRVQAGGRDELASLASDFNRMAEELDGFYHQLERKVADKSRELIRSERLASVGYLAAGVAHEINNPLGIISGYAEYTLAELDRLRQTTNGSGDEIAKSLAVIRDEAFRCKQITQKLLSLARGGDDARQPVDLLKTARDVASIIGGLKEHREKRVVVRGEEPADAADGWDRGRSAQDNGFTVTAVEQEMKQVLLNLAVNALEAVSPVTGEVRIDVRRLEGQVELVVADNGRGMSSETLERVFEPFFTEKRGRGGDGQGTGLGLSITHAIVRNHGGTIAAESDGVGKGSRFVVRLPAEVGAAAV